MRDGQGWAMGMTAKIGGQGRAMGRGRAREVGWRRGVGGGGAVREAQEFSQGQASRGKGGKGGGRAGEVSPHWDGRGVTVWGGGRVVPLNPRHLKRTKNLVKNDAVAVWNEGGEIKRRNARGCPLGLLRHQGILPFIVCSG